LSLNRRTQWLAGLLVLGSFPIFTWLVYAQGTGTDASTHFFYIPIVAAAIFLGDYWGMAVAVAAGIVTLWVPGGNHTGEHLPDFVVRICIFYATAILAARLSGIIRQRMAETASLLEVSRAINSSLRVDDVLQRIAAKAVELTDALGCSILLLDREHQMLVFRASYGLSEDYVTRYPVRVSESALDAAVLQSPTDNPERIPACEGREDVPGAGIATILCVPVMGREEALGVIRIYTKPNYHFSRSERALLTAFATQAAIAIENANLYEDIRQNYRKTVSALTRAIEAKDPATLGHSERATQFALQVGEHLKLPKERLEALEFGGLLHDIGKIGLDDSMRLPSLMAGPGDDMIMRLHPLIGKSILEPVDFLQPSLEVVLYHHERFDGSGYPEGLSGEDIPFLARLFAVANTYDGLTSGNTEQTSLGVAEALEQLRRLSGSKLDPALVEAFAAAVTKPQGRGKRSYAMMGD